MALKKEKGFTLMELLVVLLILALLSAVAVPQVMKYLGRAKTGTAKLQIEAVLASLDFYKIDVGKYPTDEQGLKALLHKPSDAKNWLGPYVKKTTNIMDPWGRKFFYKSPGEHGVIDVYSYGADRQEGGEGEDIDVVSWEK